MMDRREKQPKRHGTRATDTMQVRRQLTGAGKPLENVSVNTWPWRTSERQSS